MLGASRFSDQSACAACGIVGSAVAASGNVQTNALGALRMGDTGLYACCCTKKSPVEWIATAGAATVLINNEPAVAITYRTTAPTGVGALLVGSGNVLVGGVLITMEEQARADALAMIDKGLRSLDRWNAEDRKHFREWFGTDSEEARQKMRERLLKMREKLLKAEIERGSLPGMYGHVYPWSNKINVDERFWGSPRTGEDSRAGTIIHETSHFWDTADTDDHVYGWDKCRQLAAKDPAKAQKNADNYEYWLETLP